MIPIRDNQYRESEGVVIILYSRRMTNLLGNGGYHQSVVMNLRVLRVRYGACADVVETERKIAAVRARGHRRAFFSVTGDAVG